MRSSPLFVHFLAGAVHSLPVLLAERGLINVSPVLSPTLDLSSSNSCFGLGISVCDPINVGGTQNSNNGDSNDSSSPSSSRSSSSSSESGGLLDLSPVITPIVDLSSDNDCTGVGISACDPINVNGTQNSNNSNADARDFVPSSKQATDTSSGNDGSSLINLSPVVAPVVDASSHDDCIALGISVCDPINVNGTQNSNNNNNSKDVTNTPSKETTMDTDCDEDDSSLVDIDPTLAPDLDLSSSNDCIGLGISACDPINVGGTQNSNNNNGNKPSKRATKTTRDTKSSCKNSALIDIAPTVAPVVDGSSKDDCFGIGISACDPINVNGTQNSNNNNS
ncbi:hypothetical protein F5Y19DRAFT_339585 [Xylariaceae sp. FL1651]|nr:hypothetical protein F5Y19DRAFT_339585 [Xylariaceae sp. FL1651]